MQAIKDATREREEVAVAKQAYQIAKFQAWRENNDKQLMAQREARQKQYSELKARIAELKAKEEKIKALYNITKEKRDQ